MKKTVFLLIISLLIALPFYTVMAAKNHVLHTDIVTYIVIEPYGSKQAIKSYNINGKTVVIAEDLVSYGFNVLWNNKNRTLEIKRGLYNYNGPDENQKYTPVVNTQKIGTKAMPVFESDIKVYIEDEFVKSHNIDGQTVIYVDDLAEILGYYYVWNEEDRTVTFSYLARIGGASWEVGCANPKVDDDVNAMPDGFALGMMNQSTEDTPAFEMVDFAGDYKGIDGVSLYDYGIEFSVYMRINETGNWHSQLRQNCNIEYGDRIAEDTKERREELSKIYIVYINGERVGGQLAYSQGNGHSDFMFYYDKYYAIDEIETIRLEVGSVEL